jgi:hypothetical protein
MAAAQIRGQLRMPFLLTVMRSAKSEPARVTLPSTVSSPQVMESN